MVARRWLSVASSSLAMCSRSVLAVPGRPVARRALGLDHQRQAVEELAHAGRQRGRQLVERRRHVLLERRRGEHFDQRPAEIERAQFREREPGVVQAPERLGLERPVALAVVDLVEEREPGGLQRLEIAADRPRRDAGARREIVDRQPARRFEVAQDRPLPDDFGVARHPRILPRITSGGRARSHPLGSDRCAPARGRSRHRRDDGSRPRGGRRHRRRCATP